MSVVRKTQNGFTYIEILVAVFLISASLVPAIESLSSSTKSLSTVETKISEHNALRSKIEELQSESFNLLNDAAILAGGPSVASSYSDSSGATNRALVYLSAYDGDNADADDDGFTGTDADLLWIRVEIEFSSSSIEFLTQN